MISQRKFNKNQVKCIRPRELWEISGNPVQVS